MKISKKVLSILISIALIFSLASVVGGINIAAANNSVEITLPVTLPKVSFGSTSLTLYDSVAINYRVSADTSVYSKVYVVCNYNGENYKLGKYTKSGNDLLFTFKEISPDKFGDTVTATVYVEKDGKTYAAAIKTYSIVQYVKNVLPNTSDSNLKTLLVDLLNYGASVQNYTGYKIDDLANSWFSDAQKAFGTQNSREYVSVFNANYSVVESASATWVSAGLTLKDAIRIRYTVDLGDVNNLSGVYAKFTTSSGVWTIPAEQFVKVSGFTYRINFNKLNASQLSDTVIATIYDKNGKEISNTFSYSVETYAARMATNSDAKLVALTDAMMKYGDAAFSYVYTDDTNDEEFLNSGITLDFENGSYAVGGTNADSTVWAIATEDDNTVLKMTTGGGSANQWGFMLSTEKAPLVAGKTYKITFKVKASGRATLDYIISSSQTYKTGNWNKRDVYYVYDPTTGKKDQQVFPSAGNRLVVDNSWKEVEAYFTAESFVYGGATYTTPHFYIVEKFWNISLYFDDFEITPCENAVNFHLYDNKFANPSAGNEGDDIVMLPPERKGYVFDGWYLNKDFTRKFTDATLSGNKTAYAKWTAAITETEIGNIANGVTDLGVRVTNANSYPIKFALNTNGKVTVSIFTASSNDDTATKSLLWKRTFENSGDMGALINPAIIKGGDKLFISVEPADGVTASISNFVLGKAATLRVVSGDVDGNNVFNADDLTALQGMANGTVTKTWLGDINDDGIIATADDITALSNMLNNIVETEKYGRELVWSEEFNSGKLNSNVFGIHNANGENQVYTDHMENINFYDGKVNLFVSNIDGTNYSVPYRLVSDGKLEFKRGYLEVRAKINGVPGQWAAIWLSGERGDTIDHHGEIDIVETNSLGTSFKPNVHSWDNNTADAKRLAQYGERATVYRYDERDFNTTEYHIFGFEWNETELKFYVDGVCYETMSISYFEKYSYGNYPYSGIFDQFYSIRLDTVIYPEKLTADGAMPEFSIDYVRLYQKSGEEYKINGVVQ